MLGPSAALLSVLVLTALPLAAQTSRGDEYLKEGVKAEARHDYDTARQLYDFAVAEDPHCQAYLDAEHRLPPKPELSAPPALVLDPPTDTVHHLELNNRPTRALYEEVGKLSGIKVMFDPAGIDSPKMGSQDQIFGDLSDVFVEDALNAVARVSGTSWKAMNPTTILVTRQAKNQQPEVGAPTPHSPVITLSAAVRTRNSAMVVRFVLEGADVNAQDVRGTTPIEYAVAGDYSEATSFLLEHGADIRSIHLPEGRSLLHAVCMKGSANLIQLLVKAGADPTQRDRFGETPLDLALAYKNEKAVAELLKLSAQQRDLQTVAEDAMDGATVRGQTETAQILLENGIEVNKPTATGSTYLGDAALKGQKAMVRLLLDHGAKTSLRNRFGGTALHDAALGGSGEVIGMLLDGGADINARDLENGATALMLAASLGKLEAVTALLKRGANPELRDNSGHTAVERAREAQNTEIVRVLDSYFFKRASTGSDAPSCMMMARISSMSCE